MLKPTNPILRKNNLMTISLQNINDKNQRLNLTESKNEKR